MNIGRLSGVLLLACSSAIAWGQTTRAEFGKLADGQTIEIVTLRGAKGVEAKVITYGATLQAMVVPDRAGKLADVTLGYAKLEDYVKTPQYFGSTVGRFANRIAKGKFTLDGQEYRTPTNNNGQSLHGGDRGFDKVPWEIVATGKGNESSVTLRYVSAAGDMGYPGTLTALAKYSLQGSELTIEYTATTDAPTIVNLSNHAYWNLGGEGSSGGAMGHVLTIAADSYLPVDAVLIPTGEIRAVANTVFDFRKPTAIGARVRHFRDAQLVAGRGYDHNFVIARDVAAAPRLVASVREPVSGRSFELWSNQPGLQFYSGNFLDGTSTGKSANAYRQGDALVLEPQLFPDAPNQPAFGSARLDAGQQYRNVIVYKFSAR